MSDPAARALRELAEARAAMLAEASTTHKAILDGTIPPPTVPMLQSEMGKIIREAIEKGPLGMDAIPPRVERKISEIRDAAIERDRPRQRMIADVADTPPPATRAQRVPRVARAAIPTPRPAQAPPPTRPPSAPPQPAATALPPVSGISLADTVKTALADRLRARLWALEPEKLLMLITIAEMLEDE
jgi:hypothetical protein